MDQTELTPALERVAASVVETHRKRQQVEEDLKAAAAAVASLHAQSSSLEASVLDLRRELEQALALKAQEDAALAELAAKRKAAVEQLAAIARDAETFLADKDRASAEIAAQTEAVRSKIHGVEGDVAAVKTALVAFAQDAETLRDRIGAVRQSADAAVNQLGEIQSKARDLDGAVDGMAAKVCAIADELDHAERDRQKIVSPSDELRRVSAALEVRRAEAQSAAAEMDRLLASKELQTATLAQQIERLSELTEAASPPTDVTAPATRAVKQQPTHNGSRPRFDHSVALIGHLGSLGFVGADEAAAALDILADEDVDRFVRSLWSRAMGGPQPGPYRLIIGSALAESGDHKGAMTFFNKALEGRNVDPFLTYLVAVALLRMKRYVDVLRIAQTMSRVRNGKMLARNIEALQLADSGRLDEAEKKFAEAVSISGHPRLHHNETMYNLAHLAQARGDTDTAVMWFEKVVAADPSYRDVAVHIESLRTKAPAG